MLESKDKENNLNSGRKKQDTSAQDTWMNKLDNISVGVEIEYDLVMGYSMIIMRKTIQIARQLDIPEKQIQRWVALRTILYRERNRVVESLLDYELPVSTEETCLNTI